MAAITAVTATLVATAALPAFAAAAPDAPTSVATVAGESSVWVSWDAPASDGGSPITGYTVTVKDGATTVATAYTAYTANDDDTVSVIDMSANTMTDTITVGAAMTCCDVFGQRMWLVLYAAVAGCW